MRPASALLEGNAVRAVGSQKTFCAAQRTASSLKTPGDNEPDKQQKQTSRLVATNHNISDVDWLHNLNEDITWIQGDPIQEISHQLTQSRQTDKTINELHIIAHGSNGEVKLGNTLLTKKYLEESSPLLQESKLEAIYLWSCEAGLNRELTTTLEKCTGADVYSGKAQINREQPNIFCGAEKTASLEALIGQEHLQHWSSSLIFTTLVETSSYATQVEVLSDGHYAYIADSNAGVQIVDLQTSPDPTIVGNHPTEIWSDSAWDVVANSTHAFVAYDNLFSDSRIHILDISNPVSPVLVDSITLPGSGIRAPYQLTLNGNDLYVGDTTAGIHVVDVSDPNNASVSETFGTGANFYAIAVGGDYVFAATSLGLKVYDSSRVNIATASLTGSGHARHITLSADAQTAFIANLDGGLDIFDISTPSNPQLLDNYITPGATNEVTLSSDESLAYLADNTNGIVVLDISDTSNIQLVDTYSTTGIASGVNLSSDGKTIFAVSSQISGDQSSHGLQLGILNEIDPLIIGPSGSEGDATSSKSIAENTTAVSQLTANETVSWSLNGGATDNAGNTANQTVTITVTDVGEIDPLITGPSGSEGENGISIAQTGTNDGSGNLLTTEAGGYSGETTTTVKNTDDDSNGDPDQTNNSKIKKINTPKDSNQSFDLDQTSTTTSISILTSKESNQLLTTFNSDMLTNYYEFQPKTLFAQYNSLLGDSGGGGGRIPKPSGDGGTDQERGVRIIANSFCSTLDDSIIQHDASTNDTFFVVLTGKPTSGVTVSLKVPDSLQGILSSDELYSPLENWNTPQKVTFSAEALGVSIKDKRFKLIAIASKEGGYTGTEKDSAIFKNSEKSIKQVSTGTKRTENHEEDPVNLDVERLTVHEELSPMFTILRIISFPAVAFISFALNSIERFQSDISSSSQSTDQDNNHQQTYAFQIEPIEANHLNGIGSESDFHLTNSSQDYSSASSLLLAQMSQTTDSYF